jgi:GNAT superfamily N-acetyltransferase
VIHGYLASSYWSPGIPREIVAKGLENSLAFGLFAGSEQIGLARVITDRATYAYLADVFVLEGYRGRGLSKWLLQCILSHPDLQGLRRFSLATRDAHTLYAQFGFAALANPGVHMEILRPDIYRN